MTASEPDFSGRVALVTGASRGLGYAVARALALAGAHVLLVGRTQGALEALYDDIRANGGAATGVSIRIHGRAFTASTLTATRGTFAGCS